MGRPQLGFPRLRVVAWRATGIAIGPDHTPPPVTARQNPRTGGAWFADAGGNRRVSMNETANQRTGAILSRPTLSRKAFYPSGCC